MRIYQHVTFSTKKNIIHHAFYNFNVHVHFPLNRINIIKYHFRNIKWRKKSKTRWRKLSVCNVSDTFVSMFINRFLYWLYCDRRRLTIIQLIRVHLLLYYLIFFLLLNFRRPYSFSGVDILYIFGYCDQQQPREWKKMYK